MGNESSMLPVDLPQEMVQSIQRGNLTEEEMIKRMMGDGIEAKPSSKRSERGKKRHSGKKMNGLQKSGTVDPSQRRKSEKKKVSFSRCYTDGSVDKKTMQQTWEEQKMKRGMSHKKMQTNEEMDPQQVIQLLERMDAKKAEAYLKSLKGHSHGKTSVATASKTVPKAA